MLGQSRVYASVAVSDIDRAKEFYGNTLGLEFVRENPGGVEYTSGGGNIFVYTSSTAGTGEATVAFWQVDDVKATVDALLAKDVKFFEYDFPEGERDGYIHKMGPMEGAWFADPDGNILGLGNDA